MQRRGRRPHRPRRTAQMGAALLTIVLLAAGCGDDDPSAGSTTTAGGKPDATTSTADASAEPVVDPGDGGVYEPEIDPANFVERIDNPLMPFLPGARWVYEGEEDGEIERIEVVVTDQRRTVMGIETVVVRDTVTVDGELVEDTYDWFAQDADGNVWYFGEEVEDYEDGKVVSTGGSWEAGVDGAMPGIVMPATCTAGAAYRQEFLVGEAEDMFEILECAASYDGPVGASDEAIVTEDWNPFEPDVVEQKTYAPGFGLVAERKVVGGDAMVQLVEFQPGS